MSPKVSPSAMGLSIPRCRGIIQYASMELPGFTDLLPEGTDPRQMLTDIVTAYIGGASETDETERQANIKELLGFVAVSDVKKPAGVPKKLVATILPICAGFAEQRRKQDAERLAAFAEQSKPYVDLAQFIMATSEQSPSRFSSRTAKGLLLGFGLATATSHVAAAEAAARSARQTVAAKLVTAHASLEPRRGNEIVIDVAFPNEYQEGLGFLERLVGCTSIGTRLGYRQLHDPESFDQIVYTEVQTGQHGGADEKATLREAESYVSRRVGYVLDTLF